MNKGLLDYLIESLGYTQQDAEQAVENHEAYILDETELIEYIDELLGIESLPKTIQMYFDYKGFIRDMTYNGEAYSLDTWPKNSYVIMNH